MNVFPSTVRDLKPEAQIERYYWVCHEYVLGLLRAWGVRHAARRAVEVQSAIAEKFLTGKISPWDKHGRFRDYLKAALKHEAISQLNAHRREEPLGELHVPIEPEIRSAQQDMAPLFGSNVLAVALKALKALQTTRSGVAFYPEVQARIDAYLEAVEAGAGASDLLERLAALAEASAEGNRQPQERTRHKRAHQELARLLFCEVRASLGDTGTTEQVQDELAQLGLLALAKKHLPADLLESGG